MKSRAAIPINAIVPQLIFGLQSPRANSALLGPTRFELVTSSLSGTRSNQLSYEPDFVVRLIRLGRTKTGDLRMSSKLLALLQERHCSSLRFNYGDKKATDDRPVAYELLLKPRQLSGRCRTPMTVSDQVQSDASAKDSPFLAKRVTVTQHSNVAALRSLSTPLSWGKPYTA